MEVTWRSVGKVRYQVILDIEQMDGPADGERGARHALGGLSRDIARELATMGT